jgi:hypothetical protein
MGQIEEKPNEPVSKRQAEPLDVSSCRVIECEGLAATFHPLKVVQFDVPVRDARTARVKFP